MMQPTRERLLDTSIRLMSVKGFNNTGIAEILNETGVPKGSFYHYFKSKDDLGLAIIDCYGSQLTDSLSHFLASEKGSALTRLHNYFLAALTFFKNDFKSCNCLLGNLGQELAMQNEAMRTAINNHYRKIENVIGEYLQRAQQEGELVSSADTDTLAKMLFSCWEGCLVRAKLEQSTQPLHDMLTLYFSMIFIADPKKMVKK
jgi:TetR/AcrR family transcriptional repressor of nem operon